MKNIRNDLNALGDRDYQEFHSRLIPEVDPSLIIGIRTPVLRKYAKDLCASYPEASLKFINQLPHKFYEENNLHGMILMNLFKDVDIILEQVEIFLPYVDNWATCDMIAPKAFRKDPEKVYSRVKSWLMSDHVFTKRFALVTLLKFFLEKETFSPDQFDLVLENVSDSDDYFVRMGAAWYFAEALIKQFDPALVLFEQKRIPKWINNKAVSKACESYRINDKKKEYLRTLKQK